MVILDDAYNYLRLAGLKGRHRTEHKSNFNTISLARTLGERIPPLTETEYQATTSMNHVSEPHKHVKDINGTARLKDDPTRTEQPISNEANLLKPFKPSASLLVSSAPDQKGAKRLTAAYQEYISTASKNGCDLNDLAYSLAVRKTSFSWRSFAVMRNGCAPQSSDPFIQFSAPSKATTDPRIVFVFTGQGAQYLGMGRELSSVPVFRESLEQCKICLQDFGCPWSLMEILDGTSPAGFDIESPMYSQTLTTCLQIALADLLRSIGITPSFVIGHSSGEIAAAYASGALSRDSAVRVAYYRGLLSSHLAAGSVGLTMMAVGLSRTSVESYLHELKATYESIEVQIGCVNSRKSITLTGNEEQLSTLEGWFHKDQVFCRKLRVPVAYHSQFMDSISENYAQAIQNLESGRRSGFVPMISTVTGDIVGAMDLTSAGYWTRNLTSTVEFESAVSRLLAYASREPKRRLGGKRTGAVDKSHVTHILEVGPHRALQSPILEALQDSSSASSKTKYLASLIRGKDAYVAFLTMVGALHCRGFPVDLLAAQGLDKISRPTIPDLPMYPFSDKENYWVESSLDQNFRFRGAPRHELLGSRSLDWNTQIAQWRNLMRLSELPWLGDHKIGDNIIFPAAGTLVMAMEAVRQVLGKSVSICGMQIRDATFSHAISLCQGTDTIETQLTLIQPSGASVATSWAQYRLFSREEGSYIECASGWIRAVIDQKDRLRALSRGPWSFDGVGAHEWITSIETACRVPESPPLDLPPGTKVRYGPAFQNLEWVRTGSKGEIVAQVNTESWKVRSTHSLAPPPFAVHPTTLDGLAQCMGQALLAQQPNELPTMVPTHISNIWLDCDAENLRHGSIQVAAKAGFQGYKGCSSNIVAIAGASDGQKQPLAYMEGLTTTFIDQLQVTETHESSARQLCRKLVWKPDIESLSAEQLLAHCIHGRPQQEDDALANHKSLTMVIHCFIEEALQSLEKEPSLKAIERHGAYISWMRYQQHRLQSEQSVPEISHKLVRDLIQNPGSRRSLEDHIDKTTPDGFFFVRIGRNLVRMLRGELDPLEFIFRDGLADRHYEHMLASEHHAYPALRFVELLCFKNPCMKILEVGAGTGGQTKGILDAMSHDGVRRWAQYDFTDISPSFFSHARAKFHDHIGKMTFRVLNVSLDPVAQKFEPGTYDLIVASHVLHATDRLNESLRNIKTLLKPGGKLLLFETTRPESVSIGFPWGLLKGWWSPLDHETRSPHSPCVTVKQWHQVLRNAGFTGVDVNIPGQKNPTCQYSSILISTAEMQTTQSRPPAQVCLITEPRGESQMKLAKAIGQRLNEETAISVMTGTLAEVYGSSALAASSHVILLLEVDAVFLDTISKRDYENLQSVLTKSPNVLWVARSTAASTTEPGHHLAEGLGRALMSEDSARKFAYLSIHENAESHGSGREVDAICKIVQRMIGSTPELLENSYKVSQGDVKICRVSEHKVLNTEIAQMALPRRIRQVCLGTGINLALQRLPGRLNNVGWAQDAENTAADGGSLRQEEVLVQVHAFGLNIRDRLVLESHTNETGLGLECAGVVIEAGNNSGLRTGDRVCLISLSAAKSVIRVHASAAVRIPSNMTYTQAASIPVSQWYAYHAVVNSARVQKDDTVLVHDGSSCAGQLIIQLARDMGARVLVVTSSSKKARFICEALSVAKVDVFVKDDPPSFQRLLQSTKGMAVDVCINAMFEPKDDDTIMELLSCLAPGGRLVDISTQKSAKTRLMRAIGDRSSNISYMSINMESLIQERPVIACKIFQESMQMALAERLQPPQPVHIVSPTDVGAALSSSQDADTIGKKVVNLDSHTTVLVRTFERTGRLACKHSNSNCSLGRYRDTVCLQIPKRCYVHHRWGTGRTW